MMQRNGSSVVVGMSLLLISSCWHESPAHLIKPPETLLVSKQNDQFQQKGKVFAETSRVTGEKVSRAVLSFHGSAASIDHGSYEILFTDKFTNNVEPIFTNFRYSEPTKEGILFRNSAYESMKDAGTEVITEVKHRYMGTEMTPLGNSTTSRCHTPFKISSPARHNTPADRSGPFFLKDNFNNSVQPVLSTRQGETSSSSPSRGFAAAHPLQYVCIVLKVNRWIIMLLIHVDRKKSTIDSEEWEIATA